MKYSKVPMKIFFYKFHIHVLYTITAVEDSINVSVN